jgi:hypothetical protein
MALNWSILVFINNVKMPTIIVECRTVSTGDERPVSFIMNDEKLMVEKIIDQWPGEDVDYFKVLADDGKGYLLTRNKNNGEWALEKDFPQ